MVKAIPVHFDMPEDDLYQLLDRLDGVHLTGGGLDFYNPETRTYHPYYVTAKRIFNYATQKDMNNTGLNNQTVTRR